MMYKIKKSAMQNNSCLISRSLDWPQASFVTEDDFRHPPAAGGRMLMGIPLRYIVLK